MVDVPIIKSHCQIERCLDDIVYRLRVKRLELASTVTNAATNAATTTTTAINGDNVLETPWRFADDHHHHQGDEEGQRGKKLRRHVSAGRL